MNFSIESMRPGTLQLSKKMPFPSPLAASVTAGEAPTSLLAKPSSSLLRSQVLFGSSYEPQHPKLTYQKLETLTDPILGNIEVYQFSNGMKFYGLQRDDVPLVSFGEVVRAGSIQEKEKENGVSHFLEHLIFKGSKFLQPNEFDRRTEDLGGKINASTGYDQTFYYTYDLPKDSLREAIKLRAEFIQNAQVPQAEMDKERTTVINEIGMYKGDPNSEMWHAAAKMVWGDSPLRRPILGPQKIIASISRDTVMNYYYRFYAPENRAIIMAGDFKLDEALNTIAEEYNIPFPSQKARSNKKRLKPVYPSNVREKTLERNVSAAKFAVLFDGPRHVAVTEPKTSIVLNCAAVILAGVQSSRLYQKLVEETEWAHETSASFHDTQTRSIFGIEAEAEPEHLDEIKLAIRNELTNMATTGITETELHKAKKILRNGITGSTENLRELTSSLACAVSDNKLSAEYGNYLQLMDTITVQDVQKAVQQHLNPDKAYTLTMLPKASKAPATAQDVRFSGALTAKDSSRVLANGAEILFHNRPKALNNAIVIKAAGGQSVQPAPVQTTLLAAMMERGTQNMDAKAFQAHLEENGISFDVQDGNDTLTIAMKADSQDTAVMTDVLKDLFQNGPAFRQSDLDFVKNMTKKQQMSYFDQNPVQYSFALADNRLFPNGHPYGESIEAALANIDKVTVEELKALFKKLFQPQHMTIAMAGKGDLGSFAQEADSWLGNLKNEGTSLKEHRIAPPEPLKTNVLATKAVKTESEMPLSEIIRGWQAPALTSKDRAALSVLNGILSAGMSSRLFQTFREGEHGGLCYSVQSKPSPNLHAGSFYFYIGTDHKNVPLVLELFQKEVDNLTNTLPTDDEMKRAKNAIESSLFSAQQSIGGVTNSLAGHRLLNVDSSWDLLPRIKAVTPQDVQDFAKKYLGKNSVTAITAPETVLKKYNLPVNGEKTLEPGQTL